MVVTKLDRLARSLPDARAIADELIAGQVRLNLGGSVSDPTDPVGRLLFNVLAMVAEFESDLIRLRTREGAAGPGSVAGLPAGSGRSAARDHRPVERVADPPDVRPLSLEPAEHRGRPAIGAGPGKPSGNDVATCEAAARTRRALPGRPRPARRSDPAPRSLEPPRAPARALGCQPGPGGVRGPARRTRRRGSPGSNGPGSPGRPAPVSRTAPDVIGRDGPDQPAALLGIQPRLQGLGDQAATEQAHLPSPDPAGTVLVLLHTHAGCPFAPGPPSAGRSGRVPGPHPGPICPHIPNRLSSPGPVPTDGRYRGRSAGVVRDE